MAKVQLKSETIATFGGIFHVMDVFERLGLGRLIDSSLGNRDASWYTFGINAHGRGQNHTCFYFELTKYFGCGFKDIYKQKETTIFLISQPVNPSQSVFLPKNKPLLFVI